MTEKVAWFIAQMLRFDGKYLRSYCWTEFRPIWIQFLVLLDLIDHLIQKSPNNWQNRPYNRHQYFCAYITLRNLLYFRNQIRIPRWAKNYVKLKKYLKMSDLYLFLQYSKSELNLLILTDFGLPKIEFCHFGKF